ncbi:hypothetical protein E4T48_01810 [Aureobasidium sp. EXF-10727]|nr:hypothetical protein E4T48_01810 [Aureobasidium sp. EXF-10727]KAI4728871.1 hypothetical protein E4T49_03304 [Aureobasidium sp. EXF-10728]
MKLPRPIHLILDWDGTLTRKDTLSLVGSIAYHANASKSLPPWSDFVNGYLNDYSKHTSLYEPVAAARTTLDQERQWLASLAPIENKSVQRVESSGIFAGVKSSHIDHIAASSIKNGDLQLRSNWISLFDTVLSSPSNSVSILSVNWSARFIRQSLLSACSTLASPESKSLHSYIETMDINANEISNLDHATGSDGKLSKDSTTGIRTSADKLCRLPSRCQQNLDKCASRRGIAEPDQEIVVYIGDSATDLEALLAADVGICIRDEPMGSSQRELSETLQRIGMDVKSIDEGIDLERVGSGSMVVYSTRGFGQVVKALSALNM